MPRRTVPDEEDKNRQNRTIHVVCEGRRTEWEYLLCFENKHGSVGHFGFENLKESFEMNNSDRYDFYKIMDGMIIELSIGELTSFQLVTKILKKYSEIIKLKHIWGVVQKKDDLYKEVMKSIPLDIAYGYTGNSLDCNINDRDLGTFSYFVYDCFIQHDDKVDRKKLDSEVKNYRFSKNDRRDSYYLFDILFKNYLGTFGFDYEYESERLRKIRNTVLSDESVKEITESDDHLLSEDEKAILIQMTVEELRKDPLFKEEYLVHILANDAIHPKKKDDFKSDRKFIIFDRDSDGQSWDAFWHKTDEDYRKIISYCEQKGYEVLLSTPEFEFWLLLHHRTAKLDEIKVAGSKVRDDITEQIKKLEHIPKFMSIKGMDIDRFEFYDKNFDYALKRSCTDPYRTEPRDLIISLGSNVGIVLKGLLDER